jgi:hypothetical protein
VQLNNSYGLRIDRLSCRYVIVGGGNAAGYAARTFVEHGMADGRLCIVSKEVQLAHRTSLDYTSGELIPVLLCIIVCFASALVVSYWNLLLAV